MEFLKETEAQKEAAFEKLKTIALELTEASSRILSIEKALEMQELKQFRIPDDATNEWVDTRNGETHTCSGELPMDMSIRNAAFAGHIRVWEDKKWKRGRFGYEPVWRVDYEVTVNFNSFPKSMVRHILIKGLPAPRRFASKDEAMTYAEKKKVALTKKFFYEVNPIIPKEYEEDFSFLGVRLPRFRFSE